MALTPKQARDYAIQRLTDGAPAALILDEMIAEKRIKPSEADAAMATAKEMVARNFDEPDYQLIRACAFAGDSYRQQFYRGQIDELREEQKNLRDARHEVDDEGNPADGLDAEKRLRLILACDRSLQGWATISFRGRRDLPVAFAPKGVLQNQTPATDDDIDKKIDGSL